MIKDVSIIRSKRKTISIQITPDAKILVRAPQRVSDKEIDRLLAKKSDWIEKHLEEARIRLAREEAEGHKPLTNQEIRELADKALEYIPKRVAYFAEIIGVDYGRITIRNQKTRWGSCSSKGNLNFNCLLMLTPPEIIDYVVVHELCHRKEMNHSKSFWNHVANVLPEYKTYVRWLKEKGEIINESFNVKRKP